MKPIVFLFCLIGLALIASAEKEVNVTPAISHTPSKVQLNHDIRFEYERQAEQQQASVRTGAVEKLLAWLDEELCVARSLLQQLACDAHGRHGHDHD
jgi:hypothetical protein